MNVEGVLSERGGVGVEHRRGASTPDSGSPAGSEIYIIDESCKIYHDGMVPFVASYIHNLGNCHRDRDVEFIHSKMTVQ